MISFICVNYHVSSHVERLVRSIAEWRPSFAFEIVIVDNSVDDREFGRLGRIASAHPEMVIRLVRNTANTGFGPGCNLGRDHAQGRYLCFINPDVVVDADLFTPLCRTMDEHPECGLISAHERDGRRCLDRTPRQFPSLLLEVLNIAGIGRTWEALRQRGRGRDVQVVDWLSGALFVVRPEAFDRVGGFSNEYFLYYEDVDLCFRMNVLGLRTLYDPRISYTHSGSVSGRRNYRTFTREFYRSRLTFHRRHADKGAYAVFGIIMCQLVVQTVVWALMYPFDPEKSRQKLAGISDVVSQWEHR